MFNMIDNIIKNLSKKQNYRITRIMEETKKPVNIKKRNYQKDIWLKKGKTFSVQKKEEKTILFQIQLSGALPVKKKDQAKIAEKINKGGRNDQTQ